MVETLLSEVLDHTHFRGFLYFGSRVSHRILTLGREGVAPMVDNSLLISINLNHINVAMRRSVPCKWARLPFP